MKRAQWLTPERRWVLLFAVLVLLVTSLPYLIGYFVQGDDWRFTGFVFGVEDGNSYIAKMAIGSRGGWLFRTPYTNMPQSGVLAFLPYILLGKLASPPALHEQLVALFHLFRWVAGFMVIWATYDFLAYFLTDIRLRRLGLALITLGGGLGWLLVLAGKNEWLGSLPLDFYSPETFGFLSLYGIPHLALARATLLWGLLFYLEACYKYKRVNLKNGLKIGVLWLVTALAQPITAVIMGFVMGLHLVSLAIWQVWRGKRGVETGWSIWRGGLVVVLIAGVLPAPFLIYYLVLFSLDPFLSAWTSQNLITSPHPAHYLLAYGLVLPLAILGGLRLLKRFSWEGWLPITWALALPFLAYAPFNLQRRLPEGIWVILVLLALAWFEPNLAISSEHKNSKSSPQLSKARYILLLAFPSAVFLIAGGLLIAAKPSEPLFRSSDEVEAFRFFEEYSMQGEIVLASYAIGNPLPAWAPVRVIAGHGPESVNLQENLLLIEAFYGSETDDTNRQQWLRDLDVGYIFWGPEERELGTWLPEQAIYLEEVFRNGAYFIYAVK